MQCRKCLPDPRRLNPLSPGQGTHGLGLQCSESQLARGGFALPPVRAALSLPCCPCLPALPPLLCIPPPSLGSENTALPSLPPAPPQSQGCLDPAPQLPSSEKCPRKPTGRIIPEQSDPMHHHTGNKGNWARNQRPREGNDLPGVIQLTSSRHPTPGLPRPTLELIAAHTGSHDHTHKTQAHRGWRSCRCTCASRPGTQPLARHLPLSGSLPPQSIPNLPKPAPSADAFRFRQSGWLETLQPGSLCLGLRPLTLLHFTTGLSASVPPTSGAVSPSVLAAVLGTGGGWQQPCSLPTGCL